ncbi:MAG: hypothetical protein P4K98_08025 [Bryobacteraceae bacterium]|nr:hypothetical protein [Bryobacteraceae bacterium]
MFQKIFDVFSARPEAATKQRHDVPQTTRTRVVMWVGELYRGSRTDLESPSGGDHTAEFWQEAARRVLFRTGDASLTQQYAGYNERAWILRYVLACPGERFLDFLEDIFTADIFWRVGGIGDDDARLVDELNTILRFDNLPYHLTKFVREVVKDGSRSTIYTLAYPKIIMRDNEILHENAIEPALSLLERPHFRAANEEYIAALEDYRKGDTPDCLTKCGSAFESVLKVICDRKGWPYKQTDPAKALISAVLPNTRLEPYFESFLIVSATLRNKLGSAHGAGTTVKQPPLHVAQYALNATASAILLIAQETGEF